MLQATATQTIARTACGANTLISTQATALIHAQD